MRSVILWTPAVISLLGTMTDEQLAKQLGCSKQNVHLKRVRLGIPSAGGLNRRCNWGTVELALLGRYSDEDVAQMTGRFLHDVIAKRKALQLPRYRDGV